MAAQFDLTLQEVAQIALGVPTLNSDNIKILHSLFEFLLRKLDCQEEKVTLGGFAAMEAIRDTQSHTEAAAIRIDVENLAPLSEKYRKMEELEREIGRIEEKLDEHINNIEKPYQKLPFMMTTWQRFSFPTDDVCFLACLKKSCPCRLCNLLYRPDFVSRLMQRSSKPIDERMLKLLSELDEIHAHFQHFITVVEEQTKNLQFAECCIYQTENLRQRIADNTSIFEKTLIEFQKMIHSKLSKVHREPLELFVRDWCRSKRLIMKTMCKPLKCPPDFQPIEENTAKCLSCCTDPIGEVKRKKAIAANAKLESDKKNIKCDCTKSSITEWRMPQSDPRHSTATVHSFFGKEYKLNKFRYTIMTSHIDDYNMENPN